MVRDHYGQNKPDDIPDFAQFSPALQQAFAVVDQMQYNLRVLASHMVRPDPGILLADLDLLEKNMRTALQELQEGKK